MTSHTLLWRRLDHPGHEAARLTQHESGWQLEGTAVFVHEQNPCCLAYQVLCDAAWQTVTGRVAGWVGDTAVAVEIAVDAERRWFLNGAECANVAGCVDLDLNFSPSTNLLPIRRLGLAAGQTVPVQAAWLRSQASRSSRSIRCTRAPAPRCTATKAQAARSRPT